MLKTGAETVMKTTIAIGILGLVLLSNGAAAQTAVEREQILRDFERSLVEYTQQNMCLAMLPEAVFARTPAPNVFTPPVAMVFRQLIGRALATPAGTAIRGLAAATHPAVMKPIPASGLIEFPKVLSDALPALPPGLEYRLINNDLVIRDSGADLVIAVLRDALGTLTARY